MSKKDFEKSIRNVGENLKTGGLYIFDIFNPDFMRENFIYYEFIDVAMETNGIIYVRFNKNKLDKKNGLMAINQRTHIQKGLNKPEIYKSSWKMQRYTSDQLRKILERNGFEVVKFLDLNGNRFQKEKSNFVLTVARKKD